MSSTRSISPWWALLLLPAVASVAWIAGGLRPGDAATAYDEQLLVAPDELEAPAMTAVPAPEPPVPAGAPGPAPSSSPGADAATPADDRVPSAAPDPGLDPALYSSWTTFDDAVRESRGNGKPVLMEFGAEWCESCQLMKQEVFGDAAADVTVRAAVIPVSIVDRLREDDENPPEVETLERRFKVKTFPTLVVFSPTTGRTLRQHGYPGLAPTLRWITEAAESVR